jgi:hypothetical protein
MFRCGDINMSQNGFIETIKGSTVYYITKNPTDIQITETTLINQLEEINKIIGKGGTIVIETESESNSAPLIVNAKALQKI